MGGDKSRDPAKAGEIGKGLGQREGVREKENQDPKGEFALGSGMESQLHFPEERGAGDS